MGKTLSGGLDRKKLALVHIVKKELALTDEEYRTLLRKAAGVESSRDLDERGFRKLMNFLVRDGRYQAIRGGVTLRQKLFMRHLMLELGWEKDHLDNFIRRYYHKPDPDSLTRKEAVKAIESLKNALRHQREKTEDGE